MRGRDLGAGLGVVACIGASYDALPAIADGRVGASGERESYDAPPLAMPSHPILNGSAQPTVVTVALGELRHSSIGEGMLEECARA